MKCLWNGKGQSREKAMATQDPNLIPADRVDLLDATTVMNVATIGPKGEPQVNPVWFDWDGQYIRFSQTTEDKQKYRNLLREKRIAVSILDPENMYRYLEVRGEVVSIDEDTNLEFANKLSKKYLNFDKFPYHQEGDHRVVVTIKPEHTTTMPLG
jgi:PPOX class probable F420-dependent enzyme